MNLTQLISTLCFIACCVRLNAARNVVHMQQEQQLDPISGNGGVGHHASGFAFASYYNNHMVLQQAPQQAVIWGTYPDVGDRLILKVSGLEKTYSAVVRPSVMAGVAVWSVTLDAIPSGGPYSITVYADDGQSISISDVLFGDIWVCSGQSNMQFYTRQIFNASKELNESTQYKDIRLFNVARKYSVVPLVDLEAVFEPWSLPNATTLGNFSAVCWLFGKRLYEEFGYPIGLIDTTWAGTPDEAWSSPDALAKCGLEDSASSTRMFLGEYDRFDGQSDNSQLWNAMVHPLLNLTIYGAIWYQGEADSVEPRMHRYNCTFPAMIDDWRLKFSAATQQTKPDFPFGFVQLSGNTPDMSIAVGFPDIRWHQTADYGYVPNSRMKNVFMAVSMDLPDFTSPWGSIHPRDKQDVVKRLFLSGLRVAYNKGSGVVDGPRPSSILQQGDYVTLTYNAAGGDAVIRLASREGFEFCCSWNGEDACTAKNSWWLATPIVKSSSSSVVLDGTVCGSDQFITALRYAWRESPCVFKQCAVYSEANDLPAPPFVTVKPSGSGSAFTYTIDWSSPQLIPQ